MASDFENALLARIAALEKYIDDLKGLDRPGSTLFGAGRIPFAAADGTLTSNALLFYDEATGRVGIGTSAPSDKMQVVGAIRSNSTATPAGGAIIQGIIDADNSFARAFMGHNAVYDIVTNLWNIDNVGANDAQGWLIENNGGVRFIYHASAGAAARTFTHANFLLGSRFRVTPAGAASSVGVNATAAGNVADVILETAGVARWVIRKNSTAESGSNAGSNFEIIRRDDAGALLSTPIAIDRATGYTAIDQENWIAVTFQNSWVNYASGFQTAAYMKDSLGFVHLRGLIKSGTIPAAAFTLPAGYRPSTANLLFSVLSNSAAGRVDINTSGTVNIQAPSSNVWVSLQGITFQAGE